MTEVKKVICIPLKRGERNFSLSSLNKNYEEISTLDFEDTVIQRIGFEFVI